MPTTRAPRIGRGAAAFAHILAPLFLLTAGARVHAAAQPAASPAFIQAQRAEARGQYARAEELYDEAYESDPANTRALLGRARMRSWLGHFDAAIADYRQGLQREPRNAEALSGLGWTYAWSHRFDDAVAVFQRLAREQPYDLDPKKGLAYVALWRGHPSDARRQFEALAAQDPDNPDYALAIGQAAYQQGDYDTAQAAFAKALKLKPTLTAASSGLAAVAQARVQSNPAVMILGGRSAEGGESHTGIRFAQLSMQVSHDLRLWLSDDRGLGFDLFTPDRRFINASTITVGGFYNYAPKLGLQVEAGQRHLPGENDPVVDAEQVFFLGNTVPKVGYWWSRSQGRSQWIGYAGVYRRLGDRFSLEPTLYYAYDGTYHETRGAVLATYNTRGRAQFGLGIAAGSKQSATGGKGVVRVFGNISVPIGQRVTFLLYAWRETTQGLPGDTVVAAGFQAYL
ncbi:MAG TPA: tetratricopeptide repeat protein [Steroidobacteraceae bacterium]|nr:tetratricopeptide repeat protein [Steroidobacteraceae bacterium]